MMLCSGHPGDVGGSLPVPPGARAHPGAAGGLAMGHPMPWGGRAPSPPKHPRDPHDTPVRPGGQSRLSQHRVLRPILTPII